MAGLNMSGVHCHDLELTPVPVTRYYVRTRHSQGGIAIRTAPHDPQAITITFIDDDGTDLDAGRQRQGRAHLLPRGGPPRVPRRDR